MELVPAPLLLPAIPPAAAGLGEVQVTGGTEDDRGSTVVDREVILSPAAGPSAGLQENPDQQPDGGGPCNRESTPRPSTPQASRLSDFWGIRHDSVSLSETAKKLVEASWRGSTEKRYAGAWRQWLKWCSLQGVQAAAPPLEKVLDYLAFLFDKGAEYRTINLHRSALSSTLGPIDGFCVGQHPLVCRLLKGAFNSRPPRPKLCPSWSVQVVLDMLKEWSPASKLGLKVLTLKTSMLVALASAKRPSSLSLLSLRSGFCEVGESSIRFQPTDLEKTEGMGHCAPHCYLLSTPRTLGSARSTI